MLAVVAKPLAHRHARVGRDVLQRHGFARGRGNHGRVLHRAVLFEFIDDLRDRRLLLPDRNVDAEDVGILLVDDRIDRDCGLPGLAVADDEFALSTPDRRHRVDRLDAGMQRFVNRFSRDDAGGLEFDAAGFGGFYRRTAVNGVAERIDYSADQRLSHGNLDDAIRAPDDVPLAYVVSPAHDRDADVVFFEVEHQA